MTALFSTPKTESSVRVVPLPQSTVRLILQWKAKSKRTKPDDFVLAGRKGTSGGQARMLKNHIKPACVTLGLKPATWLTFRRSWNTWADGKGISPKMRGQIVGNSAEVNSTIYTKQSPRRSGVPWRSSAKHCALIVRHSRK